MAILDQEQQAQKNLGYEVEGQLLEVCTCNILCPCWVGEDPDGGTCDGVLAWHYDKGTVNGVDVTGRTFVILTHIPGNILKGNWRVVAYVDEGATEAQRNALMDMWTGKLGGPVKDLAGLIGELLGVEQVPITFNVEGVRGTLKIGDAIEAELEPYKGATGKETTLHDHLHHHPRVTGLSRQSVQVQGERREVRLQHRSEGPQRGPGQFPFRLLMDVCGPKLTSHDRSRCFSVG